MPCPTCTCLVHLRRETYHTLRLDGTRSGLESVQPLQTILHSSVTACGTSRHVKTRHRPFPIVHPADRPASRFFSAVCLFRRLLPTPRSCQSQPDPTITGCSPQKSLLSPLFFFSFSLSRKFCLLFPSCRSTCSCTQSKPLSEQGYATEHGAPFL